MDFVDIIQKVFHKNKFEILRTGRGDILTLKIRVFEGKYQGFPY